MTSDSLSALISNEISDYFGETFEAVDGMYLDKGTSLFETLETITADEASQPVSATCASIAGQVNHVRFYIDVLSRYLRGEDVAKVNWDDSWQSRAVTSDEWQALVSGLREQYRGVRQYLATIDSWETGERLGSALAIIVHTAYHLGEIRQALCTIRQ